MTEASIILLLCILIKRAWTVVTGHFSLSTLWNLSAVSICLRLILNVLKIKCPLETEYPRQMYFTVHCSAFDIRSAIFSQEKPLKKKKKFSCLLLAGFVRVVHQQSAQTQSHTCNSTIQSVAFL